MGGKREGLERSVARSTNIVKVFLNGTDTTPQPSYYPAARFLAARKPFVSKSFNRDGEPLLANYSRQNLIYIRDKRRVEINRRGGGRVCVCVFLSFVSMNKRREIRGKKE